MGIFESIKRKISEHFEKQKLQKEEFERMQRVVDFEKQQVFQQEFLKNASEVARAQAYKEAAEKSGLQKLRAMNRARRLNETPPKPGSFFERLSEYTKKNIARREENLARTKMMREEARKLREQRLQGKVVQRQARMKSPLLRM